MRSHRILLASVAALIAVGAAACGSDDDSSDDATTGTSAPPDTSAVVEPSTPDSSSPSESSPPDTAGSETTSAEVPAEPTGTIRVGTYLEGVDLDPATTTQGQPIIQYLQPVYDTLIRRNADFTFGPMLATSWEYTDDTKTALEMKLRDDVDFTDGSHFDADAVKANLERTKAATGAAARQLTALDSERAPIGRRMG